MHVFRVPQKSGDQIGTGLQNSDVKIEEYDLPREAKSSDEDVDR